MTPSSDPGYSFVGTGPGVFAHGGKALSVVLGRESDAEFVCRSEAAAEQAEGELRVALASETPSARRLRDTFTESHMRAFLGEHLPRHLVATYLRPAVLMLDDQHGVRELAPDGVRPVDLAAVWGRPDWHQQSKVTPYELMGQVLGKTPDELDLRHPNGPLAAQWPFTEDGGWPFDDATPTQRGLLALMWFGLIRLDPETHGYDYRIDPGYGVVAVGKLLEADLDRWPIR